MSTPFLILFLGSYERVIGFNEEWFEKVLAVVAAIVLFAVLGPVVFPLVGSLFTMIAGGLKWLLKAIVSTLALPFKLLQTLLKKTE